MTYAVLYRDRHGDLVLVSDDHDGHKATEFASAAEAQEQVLRLTEITFSIVVEVP